MPEYEPEDVPMEGAQSAIAISDNCTGFLGLYPQDSKTKEEATKSLRHYQGYNVAQLLYCDNAGELV